MLTPQQSALLQYYMQKNRTPTQPVQAPVLPQFSMGSSGAGPGLESILGTIGGWMDKKEEVAGPFLPGQTRPKVVVEESDLTKFVNRLDPQKKLIKQYLSKIGGF